MELFMEYTVSASGITSQSHAVINRHRALPSNDVLFHFEIHLHIELDQRVLVVHDALSTWLCGVAEARQSQRLRRIFQEEVGGAS